MTILNVLILAAVALVLLAAGRGKWRVLLLEAASIVILFWLQPELPIRTLDFLLPALTVGLVVITWAVTAVPEVRAWRANAPSALLAGGLILALALLRAWGALDFMLPSLPPPTAWVLAGIGIVLGAALLLTRPSALPPALPVLFILGLVVMLVVLKLPALTLEASLRLRLLTGQSLQTASALDLRWLGFSYIAFRLIHTLRDHQMGRLPALNLGEYLSYVIFFPAVTAGPIDRVERFVRDLRRAPGLSQEDWWQAGRRLVLGLFKKFVIADTLALIALNDALVAQVRTGGWMWVLLYAYALQIYFDFSGYTDIAVGTARLLGFTLPENFAAPYLKSNLTQFWNSWHMTLTQWFRAYFFNPLTRALRSARRPLPVPVIILLTQASTMLLIGLWHGVTWNYVLWGLWHGLGLFVQNRWSDWLRARLAARPISPLGQRLLEAAGVVLTFQFVVLGWVFFAVSTPALAQQVFLKLIGFS